MSHTFSLRLSPEDRAWLQQESKSRGTSEGAVVKDALARARRGSFLSARLARFEGDMRGPADLSTRRGFTKGGGK